MEELLIFLLIIAAWFLLSRYVLPRLGIHT
jgi:hypothetical protein